MDDFLDDSSDIIEDIIFNSDTISETSSPSVANFLDDSASSFDDSFGATDDVGYESLGHSGFHARYADGSSFDSDFTDDSYSSYGNDFSDNSFSSFDDSFEDGYDEEEEYGNTSYGENILESIKGIVVGFLLLLFSIVLLWWNEGKSVRTADSLKDMQKNIITLNNATYNQQYDNKAILLQGELKPVKKIVDEQFNVTCNGLSMMKHVAMLQWKEYTQTKKKDNLGGDTDVTTKYIYKKIWSEYKIDSSKFKYKEGHQNPDMNYKSKKYSTSAKLGDFTISENIVNKITPDEIFNGLSSMPNKISNATNYKTYLYIGEDPKNAKIGDVKIRYTYAPAAVYTFAAKQQGQTIVPYMTKNGVDMFLIRRGMIPANTLFKEDLKSNKYFTWLIRMAGLVAMYTAFMLIMMPISVVLNVIPLFGSIMSFASGIVSAILTLILGSVVIALAWFAARPMTSLIIISVASIIAIAFSLYGKGRRKNRKVARRRKSVRNQRAYAPQVEQGFTQSATPPPPRRR